MPEEKDPQEDFRPRPFWSGVIAFGLVSLPVSLFPANRGKSLSLKMVDESGTPLSRRFFCEKEEKALDRDDIVRGYELDKEHYVAVEDKELEALAPEKSQEIDLRRFVALADINPVYFERGYFLVPDKGTTKAYRLLAKSMEDEQRAGIATFVMRGKEYLVAIIAERGILRAATLRFHDEVRSPADVGLPERKDIPEAEVKRMQQAMRALAAKKLDAKELADRHLAKVLDRVKQKLKTGKDVVKAPEEQAEEYEEESNVIDLMQVLKERLKGREEPAQPPKSAREPQKTVRASRRQARSGNGHAHAAGASAKQENLDDVTKEELYERAKELHIPGRSSMSKKQLIEAIRKH